MNELKPKHGGARIRKHLKDDSELLKPLTVMLNENQRIKLDILGGAKWVRAQLDKH